MTDSRKGSSADNRNDGQAAGTEQMLRSMPSTSGLCVPTGYSNSVYPSNR